LSGVIAELGLKMGDHDINNMIRDLDINGDGKISPDEFNSWWLAGRKGFTGQMSKLLLAKASQFKAMAGNTIKALVQ